MGLGVMFLSCGFQTGLCASDRVGRRAPYSAQDGSVMLKQATCFFGGHDVYSDVSLATYGI